MLKLKSNPTPDQCAVSRCRQAPTELHVFDGMEMRFCTAHGIEARQEYAADGSTVELRPIVQPSVALEPSPPASSFSCSTADRPSEVERKDLEDALAMVKALPVATPEDVAYAEELREDARLQLKAYEEKRTAATKPLNQSLREINSWFKPVTGTLERIVAELSSKLGAYKVAKDAERSRLIAEAHATEEPEILRETLVAAADCKVESDRVTYVDRWVFEVVDPEVVPREFLCPDAQKIGAVVATLKDKTQIPGVRVWNDPIVRSK